MKRSVYLGVLLLTVLALPARSKADTVTISVSGSSQVGVVTSFSFSTVSGGGGGGAGAGQGQVSSLSIETPLSDPLVSLFNAGIGHSFSTVTLDAYKTVGGTSTLVETIELEDAIVARTSLSGTGEVPEETVTFDYTKIKITFSSGGSGNGGSGSSTMPEPSVLVLLGSGVFGLLAFRKLQSA